MVKYKQRTRFRLCRFYNGQYYSGCSIALNIDLLKITLAFVPILEIIYSDIVELSYVKSKVNISTKNKNYYEILLPTQKSARLLYEGLLARAQI